MEKTKKTIRVVAAIIIDNGKYFATQRGYGEWQGYWEFPGGKIEVNETPEDDYPKFHLSMDCFYAKVSSGGLVLKEHEAAKWLSESELGNVGWLPADKMIIEKIKNE